MIDPATAKIIGWIGRVVTVVLMMAAAVWAAFKTEEETKEGELTKDDRSNSPSEGQ